MLRRSVTPLALFSLAVSICMFFAANIDATKKPPLAPININTATSEQLQEVPGIGPATAEKILQMRKSYGAFKSVDDLLSIKGIGKKRLDKMRKYLTVGKPAVPAKTGSASAPPAKKAAASPAGKKNPVPSAPTDADEPEEPPSN